MFSLNFSSIDPLDLAQTTLYLFPFFGLAMFLLMNTPSSSSSVRRRANPFLPDFLPLFLALASADSISSSVWKINN